MKSSKSSGRYAKALLEMTVEQNAVDAVLVDMEKISNVANSSRAFVVFLNSPVVKTDKKLTIINKLFPELNPLSSAFISLLTMNGRAPILHYISASYVSLVEQHRGLVSAKITSAIALDDASRKKILEKLSFMFPEKLKLTENIDSSLIGGFIVTIGDKQIDSSVSKKFKDLRQKLT